MVTVDNFTALEEIVVSQLDPSIDDSGTLCDDAGATDSNRCSDDPPVEFASFNNYNSDLYAEPANALTEDQTSYSDFVSTDCVTDGPDNQGCFVSNLDSSNQPYVQRSLYIANVDNFCTGADNTQVNGATLAQSMSFPLAGTTDWEIYVGAVWNIGDSYLQPHGLG